MSQPDFVFGADHAQRLDAAKLAFLDGEFLVAVVEHGADRSHHHSLSGCHIRSAAYYLQGFARAYVDCRHVHVVRVGMGFARQDLAYLETAQTAAD